MFELKQFLTPEILGTVFASLIFFGLIFYFFQERAEKKARMEIKRRLEIGDIKSKNRKAAVNTAGGVVKQVVSKTDQYYTTSDPKNKRKMELHLTQAGYMNKSAIGYFLAARLGLGLIGLTFSILLVSFLYPDMAITNKILAVLIFTLKGYFLPHFVIDRRVKKRVSANRQGFPDVMDLMMVSVEAGLTAEASIERISHEVSKTYPVLSQHLHIAAIEIRAGKPLDEALRGFGERVGLEEVQGFATMIQQSKELGTSISEALRVFSDEMRYKRMVIAEEKAYALPAKLSIPVTAFILPIVIGVAIIPAIVRLNM